MNTTKHRSPVLRAGLIVLMGVVMAGGSPAWAGNILAPKTAGGKGGGKGTGAAAPGAAAAAAAARAAAAQAAMQAARAQSVLAKTTKALKSLQAAQQAGRAAAAAGPNNLGKNPLAPAVNLPNVPDGMKPGGLVPDTGLASDGVANPTTTWIGAKAPVQGAKKGRLHVTIEQTQQQALLNWQTFNVGKTTTLNFDQSKGGKNAADWVAFNKVNDPSANPTQILGRVNAPGQVYIINQNGIIFGGSSQVNTHALVASSLPINDNLIQRGLLNNPDKQFMFSQKDIAALPNNATMPAFTAPPVPGGGPNGDVVVQKGAQITSPTNADHTGGKVVLVGPNVRNEGTINTPDGQTILAAGQQVALLAHDAKDPKIRGLDVSIGEVAPGTGKAVNAGIIDAPRGNTTIAGKDVQQLGAITSSTSVAQNGSVRLQSVYDAYIPEKVDGLPFQYYPRKTGTVTLGSESVTAVLPETGSKETVVGSALTLKSSVDVEGLAIHLAGDADSAAILLAPGADVSLRAGKYMPYNGAGTKLTSTAGQVYLDKGVMIDVSGSQNVSVPVTNNIVDVELRGPELADSPLQRDGPLRGQTIKVDIRKAGKRDDGSIWIGTPLADARGYANLVQRNVGELTVNGGTVNISAGESVVVNKGASIDVSGGWINYQAGMVETTKLSLNGHMIDIADAQRDVIYDGFYGYTTNTYAKWGITETYRNTLSPLRTYDPGYIYGGDAGKVSITAPAMALDGTMYGETVKGVRQREVLPKGGQIALSFRAADPTDIDRGYPAFSPTPPKIVFRDNPSAPEVDPFALNELTEEPEPINPERGATGAEVAFDTDLINENGFGNVTINNEDGSVEVPENVKLVFETGGSLKVNAANITVAGDISASGGNLEFVASNFSPFGIVRLVDSDPTPAVTPGRGGFALTSTGYLNTSGLIIDERFDQSGAIAVTGGTVSIKAYDVGLAAGGVIDASGGLRIDPKEKLSHGRAGAISVTGGNDPGIASILGGSLVLNSTLLGYSGSSEGGGFLTVQAPLVQIGGGRLLNGDTGGANTLRLDPAFFNQGGFASYSIKGLGLRNPAAADSYLPGVLIAPGARVEPKVASFIANFDGDGNYILTPALLPQGIRPAASLSFRAIGLNDRQGNLIARGDVVLGEHAVVRTEAGGAISLSGNTVDILGTVEAPAGQITVAAEQTAALRLLNTSGQAQVNLHLGRNSRLLATGTTVDYIDPRGYNLGEVLSGGTITVSGNIAAEKGSVLDVSGTRGKIDLLPGTAGIDNGGSPLRDPYVKTWIETDGGAITLNGDEMLFTDATLLGAAGGSSADGGTLSVASGRYRYPSAPEDTPLDTTLVITQSGPAIAAPFYGPGESAIGKNVRTNPEPETGHFAIDSFKTVERKGKVVSGGFDSLSLDSKSGVLEFSGDVVINAHNGSVTLGNQGIIRGDAGAPGSSLTVNAAYVAVGRPFEGPLASKDRPSTIFSLGSAPFPVPPTHGDASLSLNATELIDVGSLTLQGIGRADLTARNADVRGNGIFDVAGDITITAGQVYPTTGTSFTIAAFDHGGTAGSVTFRRAGNRQLPYSVGGTLNIYGSNIVQNGVLRAPIGTINLGALTGSTPYDILSGQNFDGTENLTLGAGSLTSVSAIDPKTGQGMILPYGVNLNGVSWIDVYGQDITSGGLQGKTVNLSAENVTLNGAGKGGDAATIDVRGGGDLLSYRWVPGLGGSSDLLADQNSFAIIPSYGAVYAPYAPYTTKPVGGGLGTDAGYTNDNLQVGDQVYFSGIDGLAAGNYTLLPARYALLPGAYLVKGRASIQPTGPICTIEGSSLVPGYQVNGLNGSRSGQRPYETFEILSQQTVLQRAEYKTYSANTYLKEGALSHDAAAPRLPVDAGQIVLTATDSMTVQGRVLSDKPAGGRGSQVDISTPSDIVIVGSGSGPAPVGTLVLDSKGLSNFGADSLLIGGYRTSDTEGTHVNVTTGNLTVDNAGAPLEGTDIILAAEKNLIVKAGGSVRQKTGSSAASDAVILGNAATAGSGDGALIRVSSDTTAGIVRQGVSNSTDPQLTLENGARIAGNGVILDSTSGSTLDAGARIDGRSISLNSGQVSLLFDNPGALQPTDGLVLGGSLLDALQAGAQSLSFLSYSSIDLYGTGSLGTEDLNRLELHAGEIRGFNNGGGRIDVTAGTVVLDNSAGRAGPGAVNPSSGTLSIHAGTVEVGINDLKVDQFAKVELTAKSGILVQDKGSLAVAGDLDIATPRIAGASGAEQKISATGDLALQKPAGAKGSTLQGGLGAKLALEGASVTANSDILLPSGQATLHATTGDVKVGGLIDAGGTQKKFFDLVKYTDGGKITLKADHGDVVVADGGKLDVSAPYKKADAGTVSIATPEGTFVLDGTLSGQGGAGGKDGSFVLDAESGSGLGGLNTVLNGAGFTQSRDLRVRTGNVTLAGNIQSHQFRLSADQGNITVTGTVDASGVEGGRIDLIAGGDVTLGNGSKLDASAEKFASDGKGGSVSLEAGSARWNGSAYTQNTAAVVDIGSGSVIDLTVAENTPATAAANAERGKFTGTLHIRAPRTATDVNVAAIEGDILGASSIQVEGYKIYQPVGGSIDSVKNTVLADGNAFLGANGTTTAAYTAMHDRLLGSNTALDGVFAIVSGAEIVNAAGDLALGTASTGYTSDWDLSTYRFGPKGAAGVLTLRASGDITFNNSLSDGFDRTQSGYSSTFDPQKQLWTAPLMAYNPLLPVNAQSWSYRIAAGADLGAADFRRLETTDINGDGGSLKLGKNGGKNIATTNTTANPAKTDAVVVGDLLNPATYRYQVIRTGSGDIDIYAGQDIQLLNQFATIYTAGTRVADPTVMSTGEFDVPILNPSGNNSGSLGAPQQVPFYSVQYSMGGGDVNLTAQGDIIHLTKDTAGNLIPDSERQLPMNWLYRRGYVDTTGQFGLSRSGEAASTTWWVDFSNFFEGIGTFGGGDVTLSAGRDVTNVDAAVATNARMPKGTPDASKMIELGGGDLTVSAGRNIDAGVYYVERGQGVLSAGNEITTNATRSPSLAGITSALPEDPKNWLPTTLFLGKGTFDVSATGDLLLGPTGNPFLLPGGLNNTFWYKTYFSTYAPTSGVQVASLTGQVTLRESANNLTTPLAVPMLQQWMENVLLSKTSNPSNLQPWLRLNETQVGAFFSTVSALTPGTLQVTAFSDDINLVGNITLSPSATGSLDLVTAGSINGLQPHKGSEASGIWGYSVINLSDADPASIPGVGSPFAYQSVVGLAPAAARTTGVTGSNFMQSINDLFKESGSTTGTQAVLQTKQTLHAAGVLHADDAEPVRLYAGEGDISGLTLFSGKSSKVVAGRDITDIALYVQNTAAADVSMVSAGRDIIAYNPSSHLRTEAGSTLNFNTDAGGKVRSGDIQVSGPGTLEVLAGRNLDLGVGPGAGDGTGLGITSIGNARNPYLPFEGAEIIAGAGIGPSFGLNDSPLDFKKFISTFVTSTRGARYLAEFDKDLTVEKFGQLGEDEQSRIALDIFYLVLRDAGRDYNDPDSPDYRKGYQNGYDAIAALFPHPGKGDISLTSREIKTQSGGGITLFAPGGGLTVGFDIQDGQSLDQGLLTEAGGNISIFTRENVTVGTSRIFTLRGGNEIIWSSEGNIAAGASSKTVQSAPPTRVLVDPQSGNVKTDLAGLATGGGIGVLASVAGVKPGDVDLIAPKGTIDAGDAGIRVSGNLNIAAVRVLNATNIQSGGTSAGVPSATPAPPNIGGLAAAANASAASSKSADGLARQAVSGSQVASMQSMPSIVTVQVLGYGGGDGTEEDKRSGESSVQ